MSQRILRYLMGVLLAALFVSPLWGQKSGSPSPPTQPSTGPSAAPTNNSYAPGVRNLPFVYGRILTESGDPLPNSTSVALRCGFQFEKTVHPQLNGFFEFDMQGGAQGDVDRSAGINPSAQQTIVPKDSQAASVGPSALNRALSDCNLRISAPGYHPFEKVINIRSAEAGGLNTGVYVLSPLRFEQSSVVRVNSMLAPKKARKEFEKGEKDLRRNRFSSAARHFEKAVADYDKFAAAWNDLGRIYASNKQKDRAAQAYSKAIEADPRFVPAYLSLAELQIQDSQYEAAGATAAKALDANPGLASASYVQAFADFKLNRLDAAEQSARDAERGAHQNIPQLHLLLADILLRKNDFSGAAREMRSYLKEYPHGSFVGQVKKRLPDIDKRAAEALAQPSNPGNQPSVALRSPSALPSLKVYLRMPDSSPFIGIADIRVSTPKGPEIAGTAIGSSLGVTFPNLKPGTYSVEASAPGFSPIQQRTKVTAGRGIYTLYLVMKPTPSPSAAAQPATIDSAIPPHTAQGSWTPEDVDASVPTVEPGVACPLAQVLHGASRRMSQFVENLQKFDATEHLVQLRGAARGPLGNRQTRTFDYVAVVNRSNAGVFTIDEYRNGTVSPKQFPDEIATTGLPAMALVLHPNLIHDFNFTCEGLGRWDGHPAWQVHFAQRLDRPNRIRAYVIADNHYPIPLKGRIWIDAASYQVRHLDTDLLKPVPEIGLTREHMSIDYGPVEFHRHTQQLWLPLEAQIYWERLGKRFYRRDTFTNFKLFEVGVAQQIQLPKDSYCFKNTSDRNIDGMLIVDPLPGVSMKGASIKFGIPAHGAVCKLVGFRKDVGIPAKDVGSAVFMFDGPAGSVIADATLLSGSTLDLVPETNLATLSR